MAAVISIAIGILSIRDVSGCPPLSLSENLIIIFPVPLFSLNLIRPIPSLPPEADDSSSGLIRCQKPYPDDCRQAPSRQARIKLGSSGYWCSHGLRLLVPSSLISPPPGFTLRTGSPVDQAGSPGSILATQTKHVIQRGSLGEAHCPSPS